MGSTNPRHLGVDLIRKVAETEPRRELLLFPWFLPCPVGVLALMSLKDGLSSVTCNEFFPPYVILSHGVFHSN